MVNKTITNNSQQGGVVATTASASGKAAEVSFSFVWDEMSNEPISYQGGRVVIEENTVAEFSYMQGHRLTLQTTDRQNFADYASMIDGVIKEFEASM